VELTDLPGSYGLDPTSPDEEVTRKVILGTVSRRGAPDVLVLVLDARTSNSIWSSRRK
jgi:ferrous iron transport protein B